MLIRVIPRIWFIPAIVSVIAASSSSSLKAQIFYEPVQYQYGNQDKFYYGGRDPHVLARAAAPEDAGAQWGRVNGFDFASGDVWVHREVDDQPARVYSDALPTQIASLYGFTATDAANVANASAPRYFRKADMIAQMPPQTPPQTPPLQSGVLPIVRVHAGYASEPKSLAKPAPTTRPLLILPLTPHDERTTSDKSSIAQR